MSVLKRYDPGLFLLLLVSSLFSALAVNSHLLGLRFSSCLLALVWHMRILCVELACVVFCRRRQEAQKVTLDAPV